MGFQLTPVVKNLLLINVVLFGFDYLLGDSWLTRGILANILGLRYLLADTFHIYQFVTYMFVHADFSHLFFNMFGLLIFGPMLERFWGAKRFLIFYMVTGIGAGLLYSGVNFYETYRFEQQAIEYSRNPNPTDFRIILQNNRDLFRGVALEATDQYEAHADNVPLRQQTVRLVMEALARKENTPMIGASGAIFGILIAFGLLFPNTQLFLLFPPIPIKAKYIVLFYGVTALFGAIQNVPGDNVAHYAHLGGMLFGWIMVSFWKQDRDRFY
ncbi:Rhomboid family protein [Catalinimonas alkaloidigena]|uniref:Rhomboid family protein n=1 Tax=Catalinimonas alkaloidigena TaxID=1075417 RepID=A0A1G9DWM4_9BACT|nr:rhomboid family intramembrane serine protease [Catalinimonas alkaloidigena]SDK68264.1 Rhomboid family protein [Catalinimonas alkaloidigena]